jgi:hypothetical protein
MRSVPGSIASDLPSDPEVVAKAGPVVDRNWRRFERTLLHAGDFMIWPNEEPSIQARAHLTPPYAWPGTASSSSTPTSGWRRSPSVADPRQVARALNELERRYKPGAQGVARTSGDGAFDPPHLPVLV